MMRTIRLGVLAAMAAVLAACSGPARTSVKSAAPARPEEVIRAIPPADPQKYASLRDMKAWRNPYLIIRTDGVGLLDAADNEQQIVDPDHLTNALAKLPASSWPYGRVVAVQEGPVATSEDDKARIRKNRALVAGTLEGMQVLINWVPAA